MAITMLAAVGCKSNKTEEKSEIQQKVDEYAEFTLTTDLSVLSEKEKQLIPVFIQIADIMDDLYWSQYFGDENRASLDTVRCVGPLGRRTPLHPRLRRAPCRLPFLPA